MTSKTNTKFLLIFAASALITACSTDTGNTAGEQVEEFVSDGSVDNQKDQSRETGRIKVPEYDQIKQRYERNAIEFDRIATQLEEDQEITELYCDKNAVIVTTQDETYYDGENDPYTSKYLQLCRFTSKVAALRGAKGIRFPHGFFESGPLAVSSFLEKQENPADSFDVCRAPLFENESGACAVAINENWTATYAWTPF